MLPGRGGQGGGREINYLLCLWRSVFSERSLPLPLPPRFPGKIISLLAMRPVPCSWARSAKTSTWPKASSPGGASTTALEENTHNAKWRVEDGRQRDGQRLGSIGQARVGIYEAPNVASS